VHPLRPPTHFNVPPPSSPPNVEAVALDDSQAAAARKDTFTAIDVPSTE